ncbi:hypothetical protein [Massilia sp. DWR3-1-1]|uniref:DUF3108 domain-containing protein n=1 Tax=Massilia sp. DWR3-1-1 TaxID=2804559 RepID=UPI003CF0FF5F
MTACSRLRLAALAALLAAAPAAFAATAVDVGTPLPRFALLKESTHHYLRFMQAGESSVPADIWTRTVRFEQGAVRLTQRWDSAGPASTRVQESWFDKDTLRPRSHQRVSERDGKKTVEGFLFAPDKISGMPELADNTQKDLAMASPEPTFNFEADLETLQTLPLAAGYEASINFYHPGASTPPQRYLFKVSGSATIAGPAGPVDCWVVTTDYNRPEMPVSTFWFAKGTQLMVRQEAHMPGGKKLVKALID